MATEKQITLLKQIEEKEEELKGMVRQLPDREPTHLEQQLRVSLERLVKAKEELIGAIKGEEAAIQQLEEARRERERLSRGTETDVEELERIGGIIYKVIKKKSPYDLYNKTLN